MLKGILETIRLANHIRRTKYLDFVYVAFPVGFFADMKSGVQAFEHSGKTYIGNVRVEGAYSTCSQPVIQLKGFSVPFSPKSIFERSIEDKKKAVRG